MNTLVVLKKKNQYVVFIKLSVVGDYGLFYISITDIVCAVMHFNNINPNLINCNILFSISDVINMCQQLLYMGLLYDVGTTCSSHKALDVFFYVEKTLIY